MQDAILIPKVLIKNTKKKLVFDKPVIKVIWIYSTTNILFKYN